MNMTPAEIEAMIEAKVTAQLQKMFQVLVGTQPKTEWVDANKAAEALDVSKKILYEAINAGLLRIGDKRELEVRDRRLPGRTKPRYQFHLANCQKRLSENPLKRF